MARKIQVKRGLESTIPSLDIGEPGFTTDTGKLFVGGVGGNVEFAKKSIVDVLTSDLADIVTSAKKIGLIANDQSKATQNATVLNQYLTTAQNTEITFLGKDYYFDNTIILTGTNKLIGKKGTRFILTSTSVDLIYLKPFAAVENLHLKLPTNHTKSGIALYNADYTQWFTNQLHYVRNVFIYGDASSLGSTGISLDAANGYNVSNFSCYNVTVMNCLKGFSITNSGDGWANGNFFENIYPQNCVTGIYNQGGGNRFIYQHQFGPSGVTGVYCNGSENTFIGKVWDAVDGQIIMNMDSASKQNVVLGTNVTPNLMGSYIIDNGQDNTFSGAYNNTPQIKGAYKYDSNSNYIMPDWSSFYGSYSDILFNADKKHTVNYTLGNSSIVLGSMSTLFSNGGIVFANANNATPVTVEVVFPIAIDNVPEFGITFQYGWIPQNVKIEYASSSGGTYVLAKTTTNNRNNKLTVALSSYGATIGKIKFTLSNGIINVTTNADGYIGIGNIFMFSNAHLGSYYLPASGGNAYGDLKFYNSSVAPVLKDTTNGNSYRLTVTNGVLGVTQVT